MPTRIGGDRVAQVSQTRSPGVDAASKKLNKQAAEWVKANAGDSWGKKFHSIDGGNVGLSAFVPTTKQAESLLMMGKAFSPGIPELRDATFNPAKQQLVVVLTSEPEPSLHLSIQDKKTGQVKYLGDFTAIDMTDGDWGAALSTVAKGAQWVPLGAGSAKPNWWE